MPASAVDTDVNGGSRPKVFMGIETQYPKWKLRCTDGQCVTSDFA